MEPISVNGHTATPLRRTHPHQVLWRITRADGVTIYRVTSTATVMFTGPETYVFPADVLGEIMGWGELAGSLRGTLNHDVAITGHLEDGARQEDER